MCPGLCFQWWDQWPAQPRGDVQSKWRPGRNRCSYTMNMHLVVCLFTKTQGADFPFWKQIKIQTKVVAFPPVGLWGKCCWVNRAHPYMLPNIYRTKGQQSKAEQALFSIKKKTCILNIFQISRSGAFFFPILWVHVSQYVRFAFGCVFFFYTSIP